MSASIPSPRTAFHGTSQHRPKSVRSNKDSDSRLETDDQANLLSPSTAASAAQTERTTSRAMTGTSASADSHSLGESRGVVRRVSEDGSRNNSGKPPADCRQQRRRRHSSSAPDEKVCAADTQHNGKARLFPGRPPSVLSLSPSRPSPRHSPAAKLGSNRRGGKASSRRREEDEEPSPQPRAETVTRYTLEELRRLRYLPASNKKPDSLHELIDRTRPARQAPGGLVLLPRVVAPRQPEAWLPSESANLARPEATASAAEVPRVEESAAADSHCFLCPTTTGTLEPTCSANQTFEEAAPTPSRLGPADAPPFVPRQHSAGVQFGDLSRLQQQPPQGQWKCDIEQDPAVSDYCLSSRPAYDRGNQGKMDAFSSFQEKLPDNNRNSANSSYQLPESSIGFADHYGGQNYRGNSRMPLSREQNQFGGGSGEYGGFGGGGQNFSDDLWDDPNVAPYGGSDSAGVEIFSLGDIREADNHVRSGRPIHQFYESNAFLRQHESRRDLDQWRRADDSRLDSNNIFFDEEEEGNHKPSEESTFLRHIFKVGPNTPPSPRPNVHTPPLNQEAAMLHSLASGLSSLTPEQQKMLRQRLTSMLDAGYDGSRSASQYPPQHGMSAGSDGRVPPYAQYPQQTRPVQAPANPNFNFLLRALRNSQQATPRHFPDQRNMVDGQADFPPAKSALLMNYLKQQLSLIQGMRPPVDQASSAQRVNNPAAFHQGGPARVGQLPQFLDDKQTPHRPQAPASGIQEIQRLVQQMQAGRGSPQLQQLLQMKLQKQFQQQQQHAAVGNRPPPAAMQQLMRALQQSQNGQQGGSVSALLQQLERHQQQAMHHRQYTGEPPNASAMAAHLTSLPLAQQHLVAQHLLAYRQQQQQQPQPVHNLQQQQAHQQQPDLRQRILQESGFNANAGIFIPGGGLDFSNIQMPSSEGPASQPMNVPTNHEPQESETQADKSAE